MSPKRVQFYRFTMFYPFFSPRNGWFKTRFLPNFVDPRPLEGMDVLAALPTSGKPRELSQSCQAPGKLKC